LARKTLTQSERTRGRRRAGFSAGLFSELYESEQLGYTLRECPAERDISTTTAVHVSADALREYYDCARELFSAPSISARLLSTLLLQFSSS
jgi:hypothetical protein